MVDEPVWGGRPIRQRGLAAQWMHAKLNIWQFDPEFGKKFVAYLTNNYVLQAGRRRAAIPPDQMPPNLLKAPQPLNRLTHS
jgi:hypothetical protein